MTETHATNAIGFWVEELTPEGWVGVSRVVNTRQQAEVRLRVAERCWPKYEFRINEALEP